MCLLFSLSDFWQQRHDRHMQVCTDVPMVWNKPRKESVPVKAAELDYRHNKSVPKKSRPTPDQFQPRRDIDNYDIQLLREELCDLCRVEKPGMTGQPTYTYLSHKKYKQKVYQYTGQANIKIMFCYVSRELEK